MQSGRLLNVATLAARDLKEHFAPRVRRHVVAVRADATEDMPLVAVETDDNGKSCKLIPKQVNAGGCTVQVVCGGNGKLEI